MTLRHLMIFTAVVDHGGMSKAAHSLHISQPSVSQAISELEHFYGVKLFERLSKKLYLTNEGKLLLSFSRHILDSYKQMEEAMHQASKKTHIQIGCSVSIGTCLINDILHTAEDKLPQCSFEVTVTNSSNIEQALLNNQVDIGLIEGTINNEQLIALPFCEDELVLVCGKNHPLANHTTLSLAMLDGQNYVSRESGSADKNQYEKLLEEHKIKLHRSFCATSTEAIKNAVIAGRGIAIFSKRMVEEEVKNGVLSILSIENLSVIRSFHFVVHKNKYMSEPLTKLQQLCLEGNY